MTEREARGLKGARILILNQAFYPDVVSTAQHAADLAVALVEDGCEVTVVASRRGYDDATRAFPAHETWRGVRIVRVGSTGFGKRAKWRRAADFATFMLACAARAAMLPPADVVIALTSPPLISVLGALLVPLKARKLIFWAMDLNPDEAIAAGWLRHGSVAERVLSRLQMFSMRRAARIVALDRFMKERLLAKGLEAGSITVVPPWSHDEAVRFDPQGRERFRAQHGLERKFVLMYSGNHSPCHPLDTLVAAARQLADRPDIHFLFVGGGSEHRKLCDRAAAEGMANVTCLPYQPLEMLSASLSAADLHVVVMGNDFRGIVHPCKIYNVLAVGASVLYIGPADSHIGDLGRQTGGAGRFYLAEHGNVAEVVQHILRAMEIPFRNPAGLSRVTEMYSQQRLLSHMLDVVKEILHSPTP